MKQDLIKGKVDYCIFDRSFKNSTCLYARYKYTDPLMLSEINSNRRAVASVFGKQDIVTVKQVHGNEVLTMDYQQALGHITQPEPEVDAIVTNIPGLVIGIQTADCTPVLLASSCGGVVGVVHCGWRSARADILKNTITKMNELLERDRRGSNSTSNDFIAFIGPCIRQESYEVDHNFFNDFVQESERNLRFFTASTRLDDEDNKYQFDLPAYVAGKLESHEVKEIHFSGEDTYANPMKYPSRRRSFHEGREYRGNILSAVMIKDN